MIIDPRFVYRAATGVAAPFLGMRLAQGTSLSGLCIREGRGLQCDDSEDDPRVDRDACRHVGLRSMIVMPLRHHDAVIGCLRAAGFDMLVAKPTEPQELIRLLSIGTNLPMKKPA